MINLCKTGYRHFLRTQQFVKKSHPTMITSFLLLSIVTFTNQRNINS